MQSVLNIAACLGVSVLALSFVNCSRSKQYVQDQQYYRSDSHFAENEQEQNIEKIDQFGSPKKKIFVLPFLNTTPFQKENTTASGQSELGAFIADEFIRELRNSGKAIVPEFVRSADVSADYFAGDKVKVSSLAREGRKLGVSLMMIGKLKRVTYRNKADELGVLRRRKARAGVILEVRLYDVVEGKELLLETRDGESSASRLNLFGKDDEVDDKDSRIDLVKEAIADTVKKMTADIGRALEKVAWEGRIAKVTGNAVYVNAGKRTGLSIGDILKVTSIGEDVFDPVSGAYMGRSAGSVKGTLEVVDFIGPDGSITKVHSGGGFTENDLVRLY